MAIQISGTTVIDNSRNITNVTTSTSSSVVASSSLTLPSGNSASRPVNPSVGSIRWNTDFGKLEVHIGSNVWKEVIIGFTVVNPASIRGVFAGGADNFGYGRNQIEYVNIATAGNSVSFGSLTGGRFDCAGCSSTSRGLISGGSNYTTYRNTIEYVTIATTGNGISFGSVNRQAALRHCSSSNDTRGLIASGFKSSSGNDYTNAIEYVTIATTGNTADFGDVTPRGRQASCASTTRAVFIGGETFHPYSSTTNTIWYVNIATTGNATTYGNIIDPGLFALRGACSSSTRAVFASTANAFSPQGYGYIYNRMNYFEIATGGNTSFFGNLSVERTYPSSTSSSTRGIFGGGFLTPAAGGGGTNTIDYITIASAGNAINFGDLTPGINSAASTGQAAFSNGHGGLPVVS